MVLFLGNANADGQDRDDNSFALAASFRLRDLQALPLAERGTFDAGGCEFAEESRTDCKLPGR